MPCCLEESCFKINIFPVRTDIVFGNFTALKLEFRKICQLSISLLFCVTKTSRVLVCVGKCVYSPQVQRKFMKSNSQTIGSLTHNEFHSCSFHTVVNTLFSTSLKHQYNIDTLVCATDRYMCLKIINRDTKRRLDKPILD